MKLRLGQLRGNMRWRITLDLRYHGSCELVNCLSLISLPILPPGGPFRIKPSPRDHNVFALTLKGSLEHHDRFYCQEFEGLVLTPTHPFANHIFHMNARALFIDDKTFRTIQTYANNKYIFYLDIEAFIFNFIAPVIVLARDHPRGYTRVIFSGSTTHRFIDDDDVIMTVLPSNWHNAHRYKHKSSLELGDRNLTFFPPYTNICLFIFVWFCQRETIRKIE